MTESTEALWSQYAKANEENPAQRHRWHLVARAIPVDARVIVDLGCGSGALLEQLGETRPQARLVGLDVEPRALLVARGRLPEAAFLEADLETGESPGAAALLGAVDAVVCSEVLEHLGQPAAAVELAHRLLGASGRFVVTVPAGPMTQFDRLIGHRRHYTVQDVRTLLTAGGFRVRQVYRWGFPFHSLFRMAMAVFPRAVERYSDARMSVLERAVLRILYWLFFLNARSAYVGRQIVAVAERV